VTRGTRQHILEAATRLYMTIDLDEVSMRRIAKEAGVSLSTLVRNFGTKDALVAEMMSQGHQETVDVRSSVEPGDVRAAVTLVVDGYEAEGDSLLHVLDQESRLPAVREMLDVGRAGHREWVRYAFGPDLKRRRGARRQRLEDLLVVATDVYTWKLLRRDAGRSRDEVVESIVELCDALVGR
jgi:AcrR family transcriptional regulator